MHESILANFKQNFANMYNEFRLPMTLKIRVIYRHYQDYFDRTKKVMKFTNGEFTETAHSVFKTSERTHGFKVN